MVKGIHRVGDLDYFYDERGFLIKRRGNGFIKQYKDKDGYLKYHLCQSTGTYNIFVHRVVYNIFHGYIPPDMTVDHTDGNKENNDPANLQLLPATDNAVKGNAKYWDILSPDGIHWNVYNMEQFAREHNLHAGHMRDVCHGNLKSYKGWIKA